MYETFADVLDRMLDELLAAKNNHNLDSEDSPE